MDGATSIRVLAWLVLLFLAAPDLKAQVSPQESLRSLVPAEGLSVSLWASEPMVRNPTTMEIDSRGRVWIAEGLNYRVSVKQNGDMIRVPGADQIKILSDTDHDGQADKVTVFADDIYPVPMGMAIEEVWQGSQYQGCRVYIGNSPDLLLLEDTDGDDRADRRSALLTGFRGIDCDHGLHGMTWGPDGKLYFTQGDSRYGNDKLNAGDTTFDVWDRSRRHLSASRMGTTLRVNPDGTQLEVLAYKQRNNYETAVDSFGDVFTSDNDDDGNRGCRTIWIMAGGDYGYQNPQSSRHWAEEIPGIIPKLVGTGNGSPGGLLVYEGLELPKQYFHSILEADAGTHQINCHPLKRVGSGPRSDYQVLLKGTDSWFRPVDIAVAPDGTLFVCDWYDAGVGGNNFSDQTTGRIYQLRADERRDTRRSERPDLSTVAGSIRALGSPNVTTRFAARQTLLAMGKPARIALQVLFRQGADHLRARALFTLFGFPATGRDDVTAALSDPNPRIRESALQILARDAVRESVVGPPDAVKAAAPAVQFLREILPLSNDPDPGVRRALLMALRNVPSDQDVDRALRQLTIRWDGRDRYYLEAVRAAIKDRDGDLVESLFSELARPAAESPGDNRNVAQPPFYPIATNDAYLRIEDRLPPATVASRLVGAAWVLERTEALPFLERLLATTASPSVQRATDMAVSRIADPRAAELLLRRFLEIENDRGRQRELLRRLSVGLSGHWRATRSNDRLHEVIDYSLNNELLRVAAIQLIARNGLRDYDTFLLQMLDDGELDTVARSAALEALGQLQVTSVREKAAEFVRQAKHQGRGGPLVLAALSALHQLGNASTSGSLTDTAVDLEYPLDVRRKALQIVTTSPQGARHMLKLNTAGQIPDDLRSELTFLLNNHPDPSIRKAARQALPLPKNGNGRRIEDFDTVLARPADPGRGRTVFQQGKDNACSRCHRVQGEGSWIGPDLSSIGIKYGRRELLYHILNPSGAINYNYVANTIWLTNGRILSGLIVSETAADVVLKTAQGERIHIARSDIDDQQPQSVSLMPEDLVGSLSDQDLADLIGYLATLQKPASTAGQYYLLGPLPSGKRPGTQIPDLSAQWPGISGDMARWQQVAAAGDGYLDLSTWLGSTAGREVFCCLPVISPGAQRARLVVNSTLPASAWLNGRPIRLVRKDSDPSRWIAFGQLPLTARANQLVIRLQSGKNAAELITTLITDREISYAFGKQ